MKNRTLSQRFIIFTFAILMAVSVAWISASSFATVSTSFALGRDEGYSNAIGNGETIGKGDICLNDSAENDSERETYENDKFTNCETYESGAKANKSVNEYLADSGEFRFDGEDERNTITRNEESGSVAANGNWGGKNASDLWYFGDNGLNLTALKKTIMSWGLPAKPNVKPLVIAVVDTGINVEHELFKDVLLRNPEGVLYGYNSYKDNGDIADTDGKMHGTAVAGVIAMMIHELGLENYIKIYPIKASYGTTESRFNIASVTRAINRAADVTRGFNVVAINLSFGIQKGASGFINWDNDPALLAAINNASKTINIVAAAGNNSKNSNNDPYYPAVLGGVVSVMGYNNSGTKVSTSNFGDEYKLIAPGDSIWTAKTGTSGAVAYQTISGTSFAAPFAAMSSALSALRFQKEGISVDAHKRSRVLRKCGDGIIKYSEKGTEYSLKKLSTAKLLTDNVNIYFGDYDIPTQLKILASTENKTESDDLGGKRFVVRLGALKPIQLNASVQPFGDTDPDYENLVEWYVVDSLGDKLVGQGRTFTFTPTGAGEFSFYAKLKVGGEYLPDMAEKDMVKVRVFYQPFIGDMVKITLANDADKNIVSATDKIKVYTTETVQLGLTGMLYVDRSKEVKWFVNGVYAASGYTFNFSPQSVGKYVISAKYYESEDIVKSLSKDLRLDVKVFVARPCDIFTLSACGIILIGVAAVAITINQLKKKNAKETEKNIKK